MVRLNGFYCTWHIGEEDDALIEAALEQGISNLKQNTHSNEQRKGRIAEKKRVPEVEQFVEGKGVYNRKKEADVITIAGPDHVNKG